MTKATGIGPLPDMLEQWAGSKAVTLAFHQAGLPMDVIDFPETRIPISAMRNLFEISARSAGDRCFGLSVGQNMTHATFGLWMKYCAQAETLEQGLRRAVKCTRFQQSGGRMELKPCAPFSFWSYIAPTDPTSQPMQHCDHLIWPMIRFIQSYLGPDWLPEWIEVNYPRDPLSHLLEAQLPFPVFYGGVGLTTVIRFDDLARQSSVRHEAGSVITMGEVAASETDGPTAEPLQSVFAAISLRLLDGQTDIDGVAEMIGVGVQKLQRNLRREGVDFRNLLNLAKRHRAQALLTDTTLPVIDIAFSLGYSDHANFSRAFKRMVGVAPATYRAVHAQQA